MERNIGECDIKDELVVNKSDAIYALSSFENKTDDDTVVDESEVKNVINQRKVYNTDLNNDNKKFKKQNNINSTKGGENKL
jgi:hypothetical protein